MTLYYSERRILARAEAGTPPTLEELRTLLARLERTRHNANPRILTGVAFHEDGQPKRVCCSTWDEYRAKHETA